MMMLAVTGPADPFAPDFTPSIADIAHALSHQCRYAGHCAEFYSVAEHSVRVAIWVGQQYKRDEVSRIAMRTALMHDAAEAFLPDLIRPIKQHLPEYVVLEARLERRLAEVFDLRPWCDHLREADNRIIADEMETLFAGGCPPHVTAQPLGLRIRPWSSTYARGRFLQLWQSVGGAL